MENSYFETVVKEAIDDLKRKEVGYVFSKEQVEAVMKRIDFKISVLDKEGIFKLIIL